VADCEGDDSAFEVFVRPFYTVAVLDIIRHYGWQDIWYLYSNDEGLSVCLSHVHTVVFHIHLVSFF